MSARRARTQARRRAQPQPETQTAGEEKVEVPLRKVWKICLRCGWEFTLFEGEQAVCPRCRSFAVIDKP